MRISTKGRYGTRFMLELGLNYKSDMPRPVNIHEISVRQGISKKYLEQIIPPLAKGGLIRSIRGAKGGYVLAQNPENITIGQILELLEGSLAPVDCIGCAEGSHCLKSEACVTASVWQKIYDAVKEVVDHISLEDLITDYSQLNPEC